MSNNTEGLQKNLYKAIKNNDVNQVKSLVRDGCHVNQRDKNGMLPLHLAVEVGNYEIVDYLIRRGADIKKSVQPFGYTALHYAAINNDLKCMRVLMHELFRRNYDITTHIASSGDNLLILACVNNSLDVAEYLIKKKIDVNYVGSDNRTALEWSVKNRRYDAIAFLVEHDADLHRNTGVHKKVLDKAKSNKSLRDAIARGKLKKIEKKD